MEVTNSKITANFGRATKLKRDRSCTANPGTRGLKASVPWRGLIFFSEVAPPTPTTRGLKARTKLANLPFKKTLANFGFSFHPP